MEGNSGRAVTKRRLWIVALVCGLLLLGGTVVWRRGRLNPTERQLVGTWLRQPDDNDSRFQFEADRSYVQTFGSGPTRDAIAGFWGATPTTFRLRNDGTAPQGTSRLWRRLTLAVSLWGLEESKRPLRWDGENRCWIDGIEYVRVAE